MRELKIRIVREFEANDLPRWLERSAAASTKSVAAICREAGVTPQYWYDVVNNRKSIRLETLEKLEAAIGVKYEADWRKGQ